jgi:ABC-type bacteriocin/lantibiotic exporter with double-glycine peptidase domain
MMERLHDLTHAALRIDYPHDHWWMALLALLLFGIVPAWSAWHLVRWIWRLLASRKILGQKALPSPNLRSDTSLERFALSFARGLQVWLVFVSALTVPITWLMLELPKHIINHALADDAQGMVIVGLALNPIQLLVALCAGYFMAVSANALFKYLANNLRGRINERIVRRIRLDVVRSARYRRHKNERATLVAVAVQECEPIGYFGGSLLLAPLIQGGTLLVSFVFLLMQDVALALAAVMMLPVQLTILPRLQRRLNAKVRERVYATRQLSAYLSSEPTTAGSHSGLITLRRRIKLVEDLERMRIEIHDLKSRMKSLYNYLSNLTPFFFFAVGGYLVLQDRLSLGALVAALAAFREIAPALRELFDFAQAWSDARARFAEVTRVIKANPDRASTGVTEAGGLERLRSVG